MQHLPPRIGQALGWCALLVGAVILLPLMAFLIVTLRMVLLPVALAVAVVALALVFFGPPRFRTWLCADRIDGEQR